MTVYVDTMRAHLGRMIMSHMVADSREELDAMADRIGVARKWIQDAGTYREHYDVSTGARERALAAGAIEVTQLQLGRIITAKKSASPHTAPSPAPRGEHV